MGTSSTPPERVDEPGGTDRPSSAPPGSWRERAADHDPDRTLDVVGIGRPQDHQLGLDRGTQLDRYLVLERIGRGGMGVVYAAYDPELDRRIAVKLLHPTGRETPRARRRLVREAQAMARLSHPNVVHVHDVGEHEGVVYIAMELVEGMTLRQWQKAEPRTWREVRDVYVQAGRGLAAAHAAGMLHRDFKPDNVLVGRDGIARVGDFGIARALDPTRSSLEALESITGDDDEARRDAWRDLATHDGAVLGTPGYMSLEQLSGEPTDARADQFSFCVGLWQGLFGERPFDSETPAVYSDAVARGKLRPRPAGRDCPRWLEQVVRRGLQRDPRERWPDMPALLDALQHDPSTRRRAIFGVVIGVAAVGFAAWAGWQARAPDDPCSFVADKLVGTWDAGRRDELRAAFAASNVSYADDAWRRVEAGLDDYAADLHASYLDACQATNVRAEQSAALMDARFGCLHRRRHDLTALVDRLARADAPTVQHAVDSVAGLPDVARCDDREYVLARDGNVVDPEQARLREPLVRDMSRARASSAAGDYEEATSIARDVLDRARAAGLDALALEARAELGMSLYHAGDHVRARPELEATYFAARRAGLDELAAIVATDLVVVLGRGFLELDEARWWGEHAAPEVDRFGDDRLRIRLDAGVSGVLVTAGDLEGAATELESALARAAGSLDEDAPLWANLLERQADLELERGHHALAVKLAERALARMEAAYGPRHPQVIGVLNTLTSAKTEAGDYDTALQLRQRQVAIALEALGERHPTYAIALTGLARIHAERRELDEALALFEQAAAVNEAIHGAMSVQRARAMSNVAVTHYMRGEIEQGLRIQREAIPVFERAFGPDHPDFASQLGNLGVALTRQHRYDEAEEILRRELELRKRIRRGPHPDLVKSYGNLGGLYRDTGDYEAARDAFEHALQLAHESLVPDHPFVASIAFGLGRTELAAGRPRHAVPPLERARAIALHRAHDPELIADVELTLAQARAAMDADPAAAIELARSAHARYLELGATEQAQGAAAWLSERGATPAAP